MKCKWKNCDNDVTGKALYCSGACRVKQSRASTSVTPEPAASVTDVTVKPQSVTVEGSVTMPRMIERRYNRQAVACDEFNSRPTPLDPTDRPIPHNRGRYVRRDGTVYQFDARGQSFDCKHPFTDRYGKSHLAVYETVADVREATA